MKFCQKCGFQNEEEAQYCAKCGSFIGEGNPGSGTYYESGNSDQASRDDTLSRVALVFGIIAIVVSAVLLLPLAWMIPRTLKVSKARKEHKPLSIGFCVCYLLFVNVISGILLLCRDSTRKGSN